ncbi:flagellar biosynthesis protein FlhF [Pullulanibacillus camelliae]|uniref:Flagellar biosynthesis protein FlhF n=1 Tax=Pullulanibacillus camelliae TaxID=1707096 RepID=A0A8J3DXX4_9BACL|nr:flagellar biosynthesis protein FlhF [Pullulanibacillus camelliae]GGE46382.1 flagellar biosynthesis protein FlhF [Pullulanibacillus camelliae]
MKIKKFVANSMPEAMSMVKKELGNNAVILYTKNVKKRGLTHLFKSKSAVEVVAALDQVASSPEPLNAFPMPEQEPVQPTKRPEQPVFERKAYPTQLSDKQEPKTVNPQVMPSPWTSPLPVEIKGLHDRLIREGLPSERVNQLVQTLLKAWFTSEDALSEGELKQLLRQALLEQLAPIPFKEVDDQTKVITLVGPTGVGKTTTAAKLASKLVLEQNKKVAFITTDTYRIAAVEQLKTYAKILNIPVKVAYTHDEFQEAIIALKDVDLIIVDTAGRNYQQQTYIGEMERLLGDVQAMKSYLVLSATAKTEDIERIAQLFSGFALSGYIFTKLDETLSMGSVINVILSNHLGAAYLTTGQNVPDDIIKAEKSTIVNQLIEGVWRG